MQLYNQNINIDGITFLKISRGDGRVVSKMNIFIKTVLPSCLCLNDMVAPMYMVLPHVIPYQTFYSSCNLLVSVWFQSLVG